MLSLSIKGDSIMLISQGADNLVHLGQRQTPQELLKA